MTNELQLAALEDIDELMALYKLAGDLGRANGSSDWDDTYPTLELALDDVAHGALYVLREGGRIVSAFSLHERGPMDDADLPWSALRSCTISRLCVAPALQGRGMGARMLRRFARVALEKGFESVRLMTPTVNLAANRMYRRLGFAELGLFPFEGMDFVCYESELERLLAVYPD